MKLVIPGRLDGLNSLIDANRRSRFFGAYKKREQDDIVAQAIESSLPGVRIQNPVDIHFVWIEPSKKRDPDNVASGKKFILDALVKSGVLENDTHRYVRSFTDDFEFDKDNPRIEVEIIEKNDEEN